MWVSPVLERMKVASMHEPIIRSYIYAMYVLVYLYCMHTHKYAYSYIRIYGMYVLVYRTRKSYAHACNGQ